MDYGKPATKEEGQLKEYLYTASGEILPDENYELQLFIPEAAPRTIMDLELFFGYGISGNDPFELTFSFNPRDKELQLDALQCYLTDRKSTASIFRVRDTYVPSLSLHNRPVTYQTYRPLDEVSVRHLLDSMGIDTHPPMHSPIAYRDWLATQVLSGHPDQSWRVHEESRIDSHTYKDKGGITTSGTLTIMRDQEVGYRDDHPYDIDKEIERPRGYPAGITERRAIEHAIKIALDDQQDIHSLKLEVYDDITIDRPTISLTQAHETKVTHPFIDNFVETYSQTEKDLDLANKRHLKSAFDLAHRALLTLSVRVELN